MKLLTPLALSVLTGSALAACADLPAPGVCGNGVHEPEVGEDCDTGADTESCSGCRLLCDLGAFGTDCTQGGARCCPAGYACGVDGVCRFPSGGLAYPASVVDFAPEEFRVIDVDVDGIGDIAGIAHQHADVRFGSAAADLGRDYFHNTPAITEGARVALVQLPSSALGGEVAVLPTPGGLSVFVSNGITSLPIPTPALLPELGDFWHAVVTCNGASCGIAALAQTTVIPGAAVLLSLHGSVATDPCGATDARSARIGVLTTVPGEPDLVVVASGGSACLYADSVADQSPPLPSNLVATVANVGDVDAIYPVNVDADLCQEAVLRGPMGHVILDVDNCAAPATAITASAAAPVPSLDVIAAGNLDADDVADLVHGDRIEFASGPAFPLPAGAELVAATIADVNRDGRADVVGIGYTLKLRVLLGLGGHAFLVQDRDDVTALIAVDSADFDGDLYADIVALDAAGQLLVMFGGISGPGAPDVFASVRAGAVHASGRLLAGRLVSEVLVVQRDGDGPASRGEVIRFQGYPNRAIAPVSAMPFGPAEGSVIGSLLGAASVDVGVLGMGPTGSDSVPKLRMFLAPDAVRVIGMAEPYNVAVTPDTETERYDIESYVHAGGEQPPWFEVVQVGGAPALLAVRHTPDEVRGLLFRPPAPPMPPDTDAPDATPWVVGLVPTLVDPCRARVVSRVHPIQFDTDADTELAVAVYDYCDTMDAGCSSCALTTGLYLVDFGPDGRSATPHDLGALARVGLGLGPDDQVSCSDATAVELGSVAPDGVPAAGPDEVAAVCVALIAVIGPDGLPVHEQDDPTLPIVREPLYAGIVGFYSRLAVDGGAPTSSPFPLTLVPFPGDLAAGDVTGDGLQDVVIHSYDGQVGVAVQCPRHDRDACQSVF